MILILWKKHFFNTIFLHFLKSTWKLSRLFLNNKIQFESFFKNKKIIELGCGNEEKKNQVLNFKKKKKTTTISK